MKKVAITGGLSSGKTTVCQILKDLGAYVVSADEIVHQLLSPQSEVGPKLLTLLGKEVLDGSHFNRTKIANKIFNDKETLKALEQILHPAVLEKIESHYRQLTDPKWKLFVAEIPLLYEIESQDHFDSIIVVTADEETCRKRFREKTHSSPEEFDKRMIHQLPTSHKQAKADFVIANNGTLATLKQDVKTLYKTLTP